MTRITEEKVENTPSAAENWTCPKCGGTQLMVEIFVPACAPVLHIDDAGHIDIGDVTYEYIADDRHYVYYCARPECDFAVDVDEDFLGRPIWNELIDIDWNNPEAPKSWNWYSHRLEKQLEEASTKGNGLPFKCPECCGTSLLLYGEVSALAPVLRIDEKNVPYWGAVEFMDLGPNTWFICDGCSYELKLLDRTTVERDGEILLQWFREQNLIRKENSGVATAAASD
ncbi:MAG: hypothetical protein ACLQPD_35205 [Desulfomonilaceae bacterium]